MTKLVIGLFLFNPTIDRQNWEAVCCDCAIWCGLDQTVLQIKKKKKKNLGWEVPKQRALLIKANSIFFDHHALLMSQFWSAVL